MIEKLKKLEKTGNARLEYQCLECGHVFYRPLIGDDIKKCLQDWDFFCLINCYTCSEKTMQLKKIWSEKEWCKIHKYGVT